MRGAIPPLPNTLSWRGAQFKKAQGQLYIYLLLNPIKAHFYTALREDNHYL
jgi:hypothetical protein